MNIKIKLKKDDIEDLYINQKLSIRDIAKLYGHDRGTISRQLNELGIKKRIFPTAESKRKTKESVKKYHYQNPDIYRGKNSSTWKGGINRRYARSVWEIWWNQKVPNGYDVHHMDRKRKNNEISNLALLTHSYHAKIHRLKDIESGKLSSFWNKNIKGVEVVGK